MEHNVTVFENGDFGKVRTLLIDGEPWFVGKDVASALGYVDVTHTLLDHVDEEDRVNSKTQGYFDPEFGQRGTWLINESGMYSLILSSKLSSAKTFKRWVTHDVIPSIRKTGGYVNDPVQFLEEHFDSFSDSTKHGVAIDLCKQNVQLKQECGLLTAQVEEQRPKVDFAEQVEQSRQTFLMRDYCKFIQKNGLVISDRKLYKWFIENGYLNQDKLPYQQYREYFEVVEYPIHKPSGVELKHTTRITGKGQVYFTHKILASYAKDLVCQQA